MITTSKAATSKAGTAAEPTSSVPNRRPLRSRSSGWARRVAAGLAASAVTPNQISMASVVFGVVGAAGLLWLAAPWSLLLCAVCVQLRLVCNLLDGMVAVEGGKQSPVGGLYNEIPDRVTDSLFLVAAGFAVGQPWLGWCGALLAMCTAYIRTLGGALTLTQDFRGPMAKQQRMAVLTVACLFGAAESVTLHTHYLLLSALWVIALGSLLTCVSRTRAIAGALASQVHNQP
jgi:phosphatidylglycerophosphate synthase